MQWPSSGGAAAPIPFECHLQYAVPCLQLPVTDTYCCNDARSCVQPATHNAALQVLNTTDVSTCPMPCHNCLGMYEGSIGLCEWP